MNKLILFILAIIILTGVITSYKEDYYIIPKESIRIRIIPNSDSIEDQLLKTQIQTNIELEIENDLKKSNSINETRTIIKSNLRKYKETIENVLKSENKNVSCNQQKYGT